MEITSETYDQVIQIGDNDEIFEKSIKLLDSFRKKYKDISNLNDEKVFKTEVKVIFQLLHHVFTSEEELEDLDEDELQKFQNLVFNLRTVINSIDDFDLKKPDEVTTSSLNYVLEYFSEKTKDMEELNKTLENTNEKLLELQQILEQKSKTDQICKLIKEQVTDSNKSEFEDAVKWCQLRLKSYDKEKVMKVIENTHSTNPVIYHEDLSKLNDNLEEKKNLSDLINIDITLKLMISLKSKLGV